MPENIDPSKHISFMTTEHFTLQSARGIINAEIVARVNLYFVTLSSLVVALAFLAQLGQMNQVLVFFAGVAFPVLIILGFNSFARIVQLARADFAYVKAINRIRHFYLDHAPELESYMLFPPHDDDNSAAIYGGYGNTVLQHFLSMGSLVLVVNGLVAAGLIAGLAYSMLQLSISMVVFITIAGFVAIIALHVLAVSKIAKSTGHAEYNEVRFPAGKQGRSS